MKKVLAIAVLIVIAGCFVFAGCKALEEAGITPEWLQQKGEETQGAGESLPGIPGAAVELGGWLMGVAGVGWAAWNRTQGNRYKKAFQATARGIDKAEEKLPEEALKELHDALFKEQTKAGAVSTVAKLRKKAA